MDMYQHDSATMFRFVLRGELAGDRVTDLEHAWNTASSILAGKVLVVDISGLTHADSAGIALLSRMRESGARLTGALPPKSEEFPRSLDMPAAAPRGRHAGTWALLSRLTELSGWGQLRFRSKKRSLEELPEHVHSPLDGDISA